jgi:hypothetical protein
LLLLKLIFIEDEASVQLSIEYRQYYDYLTAIILNKPVGDCDEDNEKLFEVSSYTPDSIARVWNYQLK